MIEPFIYGGAALLTSYYFLKSKEENGYIFTKFPIAHPNSFGSLPNPKNVKRGYIWTPVSKLKREFKANDKNTVFIDHFRFDENYIKDSSMNIFVKKSAEKTSLFYNSLKLTQGLLLIGKMGAGKTELYFSVLNQKFYNRAIIHQVKAGDFSSVFLRKRDILFSPYDQRGYMWDVMSESEGIIKTFFEIYSNALMGDKKDFFSATSQRLYNEMAQKIKTQYKNKTSSQKWLLFIKTIKDLFEEMDSGSQNSKKDVKGTMESMIEPLEIMAWKMQNPKQKSFIIKDYFKKKNQTKLILDNISEFEKALTPLYSAFLSCVSQVHTSLPDTKTDFTLYALDEYLSLATIMDEPSKKRLHTLIRSKGGILMPAVQYIPKDDKKLQQMLTSSAYAWIYFSVIDDETIDLFKKTIGEVEYSYQEENISYSKNSKNKSFSTKNCKDFVIYNELINGLGENFEHLVYLPNHKMLYKGYTPQVELKTIAKKYIPIDLQPFYDMKYKSDNLIDDQELRNLTFADLFKEKPLSKLEEYKLFKKFEKAKKENKTESFAKDNNLVNVNFELLFQDYIPNDKVIDSKMKILSVEERFELMQQWQAIDSNDHEAQIKFIEEHSLWGACPQIFENLGNNLEDLTDL